MRSCGSALIQCGWCPHKEGKSGRRLLGREEAMWTCRSLTSQKEKPGSASAPSALRRTQRCPHLDLGLPASGTETRIHFFVVKAARFVGLCYGGCRKRIHTETPIFLIPLTQTCCRWGRCIRACGSAPGPGRRGVPVKISASRACLLRQVWRSGKLPGKVGCVPEHCSLCFPSTFQIPLCQPRGK